MIRLRVACLVVAAALAACGGTDGGPSPAPMPAATPAPPPTPAPSPTPPVAVGATSVAAIDATNRAEVVARWNDTYFDNTAFTWSGSTAGCAAGETSDAFKAAVLRRLNFFRAMAGLPGNLTLDAALSSKAQKAALMMDAADRLSHAPGRDWACYSADGAEAAASSLLAYSNAPARSVSLLDGYVRDRGSNNAAVGHRRWILYPPLASVGTGDTAQANALWIALPGVSEVVGSAAAVAWPPRGFIPRALADPTDRLSLACAGADFAAASVVMRADTGQRIGIRVESRSDNGYGDNAIVWSVDTAASPATGWDRGTADTRVEIEVTGVRNCRAGNDFRYTVTFITP